MTNNALQTVQPLDQVQAYLRGKWADMGLTRDPFTQKAHIARAVGGIPLYNYLAQHGTAETIAAFDRYFADPGAASPSMAIVPASSVASTSLIISIPLADGGALVLPDGIDVTDFVPDIDQTRIWKMVMGQPKNRSFPAGANQLYLTRPVSKIGLNGAAMWVDEFRGPFGNTARVYPVGFAISRAYFEKFDEAASVKNGPLCRSEDFVRPDVKYAGRYSATCTHFDPLTGKLASVTDCALAQWRTVEGKRVAPPCAEIRTVGAAMEVDGEMTLIGLRFKGIASPAARHLFQEFAKMKQSGQPIWSYPIDLSLIEKGVGNSYIATQRQDLPPTPPELGIRT